MLWGSLAGILIFLYIPILTLIAFSFQEGRSLRGYGESIATVVFIPGILLVILANRLRRT